jgi:hypothetical protein
MGVAERSVPTDNPVFATAGARLVAGEAARAAERLGYPVPSAWTEISDSAVLPTDQRTTELLNHDGYRRDEEEGATPDPAAVLFPMGYPVDARTERATLDSCLARADGYLGKPMLAAFFGTWAAWRGDRRLALRMLEEGYAEYEMGRFGQIREHSPRSDAAATPAGPFAANMGGFLLGCMWGLPGIMPGHDDPRAWARRPVVLPDGWEAIEIERAWVRSGQARIEARHGAERATIEVHPPG